MFYGRGVGGGGAIPRIIVPNKIRARCRFVLSKQASCAPIDSLALCFECARWCCVLKRFGFCGEWGRGLSIFLQGPRNCRLPLSSIDCIRENVHIYNIVFHKAPFSVSTRNAFLYGQISF